jgi:hypothetical protein
MDPLSPAFPLCSGSRTCEKLLDPALLKVAGFFFVARDSRLVHATNEYCRFTDNPDGQAYLLRIDSSQRAEG